MGLAYMAITIKQQDGSTSTEVWRNTEFNHEDHNPGDVIQMTIPIRDSQPDQLQHMDIGVIVDGNLEFSTHRAKLFTRLLDQHSIADFPEPSNQTIRRQTVRSHKLDDQKSDNLTI